MLQKPAIFVGLDDVLFRTKDVILMYINERYDVELPLEDFYRGRELPEVVNAHLPETQQVSRKAFFKELGEDFLQSHEWHRVVRPVDGAVETISLLKEQYEIYVVTARQDVGRKVVESLLSQFFPDTFSGVHFVFQKSGSGFNVVPKHDFMSHQQKRASFFDDNPNEVREAMDVLPSYLFDPEGYHKDLSEFKRVESWEDIRKVMLSTVQIT